MIYKLNNEWTRDGINDMLHVPFGMYMLLLVLKLLSGWKLLILTAKFSVSIETRITILRFAIN